MIPWSVPHRAVLWLGFLASLPLPAAETSIVFWFRGSLVPASSIPPVTNVVAVNAGDGGFSAISQDYRTVAWECCPFLAPGFAQLTNVMQTAMGCNHGLALRRDGTLAIWGDNHYRQLDPPSKLPRLRAIAAGAFHSVALSEKGTVFAWGRRDQGQTNVPPGLTNVVAIAAGLYYNLAVTEEGRVVAWGTNGQGQCNVPADLTNAIDVAGGRNHSLALRRDGTVVAWGENLAGQTDVPPGLSNVVAVAAADQLSLALQADGNVVAWGGTAFATNVATQLTNVLAISAWYQTVVALIGDGGPVFKPAPAEFRSFTGKTITLGVQAMGQAPLSFQWQRNGLDVAGVTNARLKLAELTLDEAGDYTLIASNGVGIAASPPIHLTVEDVAPLILDPPVTQSVFGMGKAVFQVEADGSSPISYQWQFQGQNLPDATNAALVLGNLTWRNNGQYCVRMSNAFGVTFSTNVALYYVPITRWGEDAVDEFFWQYWEMPLPPYLTNPVALACGFNNNLALRTDGTVFQWCLPQSSRQFVYRDVGLSNVAAISANRSDGAALLADGRVMSLGGGDWFPGESNLVAVAGGDGGMLALRADGSVIGRWFQYSNGPTRAIAVSTYVGGGLALLADGTVLDLSYNPPTLIPDLTNIVAVSMGQSHYLALKADGAVSAWWSDYYIVHEAVATPNGLSNVVAIAAGFKHDLALKADGTVVAWGYDQSGVTNIPAGLSNVVAIAAGRYHNLALHSDVPIQTTVPPVGFSYSNQTFAVSVPTSKNKAYFLEYADALENPAWSRASAIAGTGATQVLTDTNAVPSQRFYRVRRF